MLRPLLTKAIYFIFINNHQLPQVNINTPSTSPPRTTAKSQEKGLCQGLRNVFPAKEGCESQHRHHSFYSTIVEDVVGEGNQRS